MTSGSDLTVTSTACRFLSKVVSGELEPTSDSPKTVRRGHWSLFLGQIPNTDTHSKSNILTTRGSRVVRASPFFQRFPEARAEALLESLCGSADRGVDDLLYADCVGLADLCGHLDDSGSFEGSDGREEFFDYTQPIRRHQRIARDTHDSRIYAGSRGVSVAGACAYCTQCESVD